MNFYKKHIFLCTNQKDPGKACCANHDAKEMVAYAKQQASLMGITKDSKIRINSSGCMGRCSEGPVMVVYPSGKWYTYKNKEDIDRILQAIIHETHDAESLVLEIS
jgi:(2Fe-2S) ferredoxin